MVSQLVDGYDKVYWRDVPQRQRRELVKDIRERCLVSHLPEPSESLVHGM